MKKILLLICTFFMCITCSFAQKNSGEQAPNYQKGMEFAQKGDLENAVFYFQKEIQENPKNAYGYYGMSYCLSGTYHYEEAIPYIDKAIKLMPKKDRWLGYKEKGYIYHSMGKFEEAVKIFTEGIKCDPKNPSCYRSRAESYFAMRDFLAARIDYQRIIAMQPTYWYSYFVLGEIEYAEGNYEEAKKNLLRADQLDGSHPDPLNYLSAIAYYEEDYETAATYGVNSLKITPDNEIWDILRAVDEKDTTVLLRKFNEMAKKDPKNAAWPYYASEVCSFRHQYHRAYNYLEQAAKKLNEPNQTIMESQLVALKNCGEHEQALTLMEQMIQQFDMDSNDLVNFRCTQLANCGRADEACHLLDSMLKANPSDTSRYFYVDILYLTGNYADIPTAAKAGLVLSPKSITFRNYLAENCFYNGDVEQAKKWYKEIIDISRIKFAHPEFSTEEDARKWRDTLPYFPSEYIIALYRTGQEEAARKELKIWKLDDYLQESVYVELAGVNAVMGNSEEAIEILDKALNTDAFWYTITPLYIQNIRNFNNLRDLPEFKEWLEKYEKMRRQ